MADSASADPAPAPAPAASAASTARRGAKPCIFSAGAPRDVAKPVIAPLRPYPIATINGRERAVDVTGVDGFTGYDYDQYTGDLVRRGGGGRDDVPSF